MIKLLFYLAIFGTLAIGFLYIAPDGIKTNVLTFVNDKPIPKSIKEKAEEFLATPAYERDKLFTTLEQNLTEAKTAIEQNDSETANTLLEKTKQTLKELQEQNKEQKGLSSAAQSFIVNTIEEHFANNPQCSVEDNK
ncbi:MAG: hypothetical protein COU08_01535 [Candidatus Harrisonbacteria bacterium CG10_big_fil_rev_8_21_14_0_10_42_17]|uniref:Uncharacterized protein n=1 Tax=Candidatus Harrisonbacteria bacterium CG10_big_fil_rev_8_21_14_0_10_42_17 TaxID=1974584 RepID=A0A2M6WIN4_9BACT|nr:MAG: hypothetical protein COU08_01535 [Candidatus Harrisonbacteria bacterium CG10_big_fil_rev_8_21_14_0_10_42_17]